VISQVFFLNISEVSELRYHLNNRLKKKTTFTKMFLKITFEGQVWQCMPMIPATQEAEVGGSQPKASPGKNLGPYLKND
jgi:hypothetical protein